MQCGPFVKKQQQSNSMGGKNRNLLIKNKLIINYLLKISFMHN